MEYNLGYGWQSRSRHSCRAILCGVRSLGGVGGGGGDTWGNLDGVVVGSSRKTQELRVRNGVGALAAPAMVMQIAQSCLESTYEPVS